MTNVFRYFFSILCHIYLSDLGNLFPFYVTCKCSILSPLICYIILTGVVFHEAWEVTFNSNISRNSKPS